MGSTTTLVISTRPESASTVSESPGNLFAIREILGLTSRAVMPVEEENLGLVGLILANSRPTG
jgi:hypothetical protein